MADRHPGDYLEKRMGRGRQCWSFCDRTPCRCAPRDRRFMRKSERQRVRGEMRDARFWAAWRDAQRRSSELARRTVEASRR